MKMNGIEKHFRGKINMMKSDIGAQTKMEKVNLRKMARRAMNYLLRTPRVHLDYACRFSNSLDQCPPGPQGIDLVAHGDTDLRQDSLLPGPRKVSGLTDSTDVDEGMHKRTLGYLGDDNLSHAPYAMSCAGDMPPDTIVTCLWTTGWTIRSFTEKWLHSGDDTLKERARSVALALKKIAIWDTGRAYYPGGQMLKGKWLGGFFGAESTSYNLQVCDLMHYAEATGDDEIAEFGYALARGILADLPPNIGMRRFREDGSFTDHVHMHTRVLWGMAAAGRVMRDPALIEWARRGYEFVRSCGTDYGWFPERTILPGEHPYDGYEERADISETCCTGDMTQVAAQLAEAGYPHYWDHVERYVSNYVKEVQFTITAQVEEYYRKLHKNLPKKEVERGLEIMRDFEGGFISNILVNQWGGLGFGQFPMAGCCPPEAGRAIVLAGEKTVTGEGDVTKVNMAFDFNAGRATVKAEPGRMEVKVKEGKEYLLRPPAWADREKVRTAKNGKKVTRDWHGDYIRFKNVKKSDKLEMTWDVPRFSQLVEVGGRVGARRACTLIWQGNRVTGIHPPGGNFAMFTKIKPLDVIGAG